MNEQEMTRDERKAMYLVNKTFNGFPNVMTPSVIAYGMADDTHAWELSTGEWVNRTRLWGVTVVNFDPATKETSRNHDASKCFNTHKEAREYIAGLVDGLAEVNDETHN